MIALIMDVCKILNFLIRKGEKNMLKEYCEQAGINFNEASMYKEAHPKLSDYEIIFHFNPYCYINIQGELIIPN